MWNQMENHGIETMQIERSQMVDGHHLVNKKQEIITNPTEGPKTILIKSTCKIEKGEKIYNISNNISEKLPVTRLTENSV